MISLNEKLNLISDLEEEGLSEDLIESVIYMEEHPDEWIGPFNTPEEAKAYLESNDEAEISNESN